MNHSEQLPTVQSYLSELRSALAGVPREIANEIEDGVAEELSSLSASEALLRIDELGDPAFIAAEAKTSLAADPSTVAKVPAPLASSPPVSTGTPGQPVATTEARWYMVVASLLVAFGGIVIPLLGWVAGIVMVWMSKSWRTWEKWAGTLIPLALGALLVLASFIIAGFSHTAASQNGNFPSFSGWHAAILSVFVSPFIAGMWLLWRGLRR